MIKKIFSIFLGIVLTTNAFAKDDRENVSLTGKSDKVGMFIEYEQVIDVMQKHFDTEHFPLALKAYIDELVPDDLLGRHVITSDGLWRVCIAGGLDIAAYTDKIKCQNFAKDLISTPIYKFYDACARSGSGSDGTDRCIRDFEDIEVQHAQAKNLAMAYAKERYNDDIVCESETDSEWSYDLKKQHFLKCTSKKGKIYYTFEFDDTSESGVFDNRFVRREFARGLCLVYKGTPGDVASKDEKVIRAEFRNLIGLESGVDAHFTASCSKVNCDYLDSKIRGFGFVSQQDGDECTISYDENRVRNSNTMFSDEYYAEFNGKSFIVYFKGVKLFEWDAVSGRGKTRTDPKPTICQKPKYQACKNVGPTPSGRYYVNQNDIQYLENYGSGTYGSAWTDPNGIPDAEEYGPMRVLLKPFESDMPYNRERIYIHGGTVPGSAGCIDLVDKIDEFINWFAKQTAFSALEVNVIYPEVEYLCGVDKNMQTNRYFCDCIQSDDVATKCIYDDAF